MQKFLRDFESFSYPVQVILAHWLACAWRGVGKIESLHEDHSVTEAPGAQRRVLKFCYFVAKEFLAKSFWGSNALDDLKHHPNRREPPKTLPECC